MIDETLVEHALALNHRAHAHASVLKGALAKLEEAIAKHSGHVNELYNVQCTLAGMEKEEARQLGQLRAGWEAVVADSALRRQRMHENELRAIVTASGWKVLELLPREQDQTGKALREESAGTGTVSNEALNAAAPEPAIVGDIRDLVSTLLDVCSDLGSPLNRGRLDFVQHRLDFVRAYMPRAK